MALIKCPECGREVSDKAASCPNCGFAVADNRPDGIVRIKMSVISQTVTARQKVTLSGNGRVLWEGHTGEIAEVYFDRPTYVHIKYHTGMTTWGAECTGEIDPSKGKKYAIQAMRGFFKAGMCLQRVDFIDSDR